MQFLSTTIAFTLTKRTTTTSSQPSKASKKNSRRSKMRTGVWGWCGPPRRRRRKSKMAPPPPPPPPLSLCPAAPDHSPPHTPDSLAQFAESIGGEEGLSDMDFSDMDEMEADDALVDGHSIGDAFVDKSKPGAMIMDSVTRKWVGNETEFERFDAIVGNMAVGDILVPDDSVFSVSENVLREWTKDGEDHNKWLGEGARGEGIDIRMLAPLYSEVRARQRPQ